MIANFDFETHGNELVKYFLDYIIEKKLEKLDDDEYSIHIPIHRALTMFLSRYALFMHTKLNTSLTNNLKVILFTYYNTLENVKFSDFLFEIYKDVFRTIGFIHSIYAKYWIAYGEDCQYYFDIYYFRGDLMCSCDFGLIKLLLGLSPDISDLGISFKRIFELLMSVGSKNYLDIINNKDDNNKDKLNMLILRNFEFITQLLRENDFIADLTFISHKILKNNKITDNLFESLYGRSNDDKDINDNNINKSNKHDINVNNNNKDTIDNRKSFIENLKKRLAHIIFGMNNSGSFSDIQGHLPDWITSHFKTEFEDQIQSICTMSVSNLKAHNFGLKKEYLTNIDLAYYKNQREKSESERNILEKYNTVLNIFNTPAQYSFDLTLLKEINSNFYYNIITSNFFFTLLNKLLENFTTKKNVLESIIITIYKILKLVFVFYTTFTECLNERVKLLLDNAITEIKDILNSSSKSTNIASDNLDKITESFEYSFKLYENIKNNNSKLGDIGSSNDKIIIDQLDLTNKKSSNKNINEVKKSKAQLMKEKLIREFKDKSEKVNKGIEPEMLPDNDLCMTKSDSNLDTLDKNDEIQCCVCLMPMDKVNQDNNIFGKIGLKTKSKLKMHINKKNLNYQYTRFTNEYNTALKNKPELLEEKRNELNETLHENSVDDSSTVIYSCNHYIHFNCYNNFISKNLLVNFKFAFLCPMCKTLSNTLIPIFDKNEYETDISLLTFAEINSIMQSKDNFKFKIKELNNSKPDIKLQMIINLFEQIFNCRFVFTKDSIDVDNSIRLYENFEEFFTDGILFMGITGISRFLRNLNMLKEIITSARILLNYGILNRKHLVLKFSSLYLSLYNKNEESQSIVDIISNNMLTNIFDEILMLYVLLLDTSEQNYLNLLIYHITPFLLLKHVIAIFAVKSNFTISKENINDYFDKINTIWDVLSLNDRSRIKELYLPYLRKLVFIKILFGGLNDKDVVDKINNVRSSGVETEFSYYCGLLTIPDDLTKIIKLDSSYGYSYPSFWKNRANCEEVFNNILKEYKECLVNETYLIDPFALLDYKINSQFEFINLPNDLLALSQYYGKIDCKQCESKDTNSKLSGLVCLLCGLKICYSNTCCFTFKGNKKIEEHISHAKECNAGNCCYIQINNGKIIMIIQNKVLDSGLYAYRNKFGESMKYKNKISSDFVLDKDGLKSIYDDFISIKLSKYYKKLLTSRNINLGFDFII